MHTPSRQGTSTRTSERARAHTHTHKYVIFIVFPRQTMIRERVSMLRYTYTASFVKICVSLKLRKQVKACTCFVVLHITPRIQAYISITTRHIE